MVEVVVNDLYGVDDSWCLGVRIIQRPEGSV
jgi:hypothetical protein